MIIPTYEANMGDLFALECQHGQCAVITGAVCLNAGLVGFGYPCPVCGSPANVHRLSPEQVCPTLWRCSIAMVRPRVGDWILMDHSQRSLVSKGVLVGTPVENARPMHDGMVTWEQGSGALVSRAYRPQ